MKRMTSRESYEHLVSAGLLKAKQALVVGQMTLTGDATSGEIIEALAMRIGSCASESPNDRALQRQMRSLQNVNAWRARFTELQQCGLIVEAGQRRCRVSGRRSVVWRFTGRTKPLKVSRVRRGVKAWKALAMDLWNKRAKEACYDDEREEYEERIRALGGKS